MIHKSMEAMRAWQVEEARRQAMFKAERERVRTIDPETDAAWTKSVHDEAERKRKAQED